MTELARAIEEWSRVVGPENVIAEEAARRAAETATYPTSARVLALVRPGSTAEVRECMRVANRRGVPVYPVSRGRNFGFGSRVPQRDCAVMELARMDRIVDFDERLGHVTVEPGVTFQRMYEFLRERDAGVVMTVPSTDPGASLIGHAVERGPGRGPYGDRFGHACAMEVVLPTGECVHTGLDRFDGAHGARVYRYGVGPFLDGIFSQGNLGVVTRMTFWLAPRPRHTSEFFFSAGGERPLASALDGARGLMLDGLVGPGRFGLWNKHRLVADLCEVDWGSRDPEQAISAGEADGLLARTLVGRLFGVHEWYGFGRLQAASAVELAAARARVRRELGPHVDRLHFRAPTLILRLLDLRRNAKRLGSTRRALAGFRRMRPDEPRGEAAKRLHLWRKGHGVAGELDPDLERCGFAWLTPVVPIDGAHAETAAGAASEVLARHGFDPILEIVPLSARSAELLAAIVYDRDLPGADERAVACHRELLERCCDLGYVPYRLSHLSMDALPPARDDYGVLMERLKRALDPNDVLAPGRYDFRAEWPGD
jgi:4-cresol dehydrogenase (hydroxylating)